MDEELPKMPNRVECPEHVEGHYDLLLPAWPHYAHGLRPLFQMTEEIPKMPNRVECPEHVEGQFYVYLLLCSDTSLYCGSTEDLTNRLNEHNSGEGASWTKIRRPVKLVYFESHKSLLSARRREKQIKGWTTKKKINLITGFWKNVSV